MAGRYVKMDYRSRFAFSLIEVLVVVVVIALLVTVLIFSFYKARKQAKLAICTSNLHQQAQGMVAYSMDHESKLPYRGWRTYTVAETMREALGRGGNARIRCNLGLLQGKWAGEDWNVLYCPVTYNVRDMLASKSVTGGYRTVDDPKVHWSLGGYDYAVPLNQRFRRKLPGETHMGYSRARRSNPGSYPMLSTKDVYPPAYISSGYWEFLQKNQGISDPNVKPRLPQGPQALVSDWLVGYDPSAIHNDVVNVLYSDGHTQPFEVAALPGTGRAKQYETWFYFNNNQ